MNEIWKDIPGYETKYQASTEGRVRSLTRSVRGVCHFTGNEFTRIMKGRILRPGKYCKTNHVSVILGRGTNGKPVHQLVARTFLGECPKGKEVLHKNGNPQDNRLVNLRYGTRSENIIDVFYQGQAWKKFTIEDVYDIRFYLLCKFTCREIAKMYSVSITAISSIKNRRTYAWLK